MSERRWTPGPWVAENSSIIAADGGIVACMVSGSVSRGDCDEDYATANLVAASIDLYDALDQAVTSMQDSGYPNGHLAVIAARAALKRARGES